MALIKKIDVPMYLAARRARRRAGALFMGQPVESSATAVKISVTKANASGFEEDFSLEHSALKIPAAPSK